MIEDGEPQMPEIGNSWTAMQMEIWIESKYLIARLPLRLANMMIARMNSDVTQISFVWALMSANIREGLQTGEASSLFWMVS